LSEALNDSMKLLHFLPATILINGTEMIESEYTVIDKMFRYIKTNKLTTIGIPILLTVPETLIILPNINITDDPVELPSSFEEIITSWTYGHYWHNDGGGGQTSVGYVAPEQKSNTQIITTNNLRGFSIWILRPAPNLPIVKYKNKYPDKTLKQMVETIIYQELISDSDKVNPYHFGPFDTFVAIFVGVTLFLLLD